MTYHVTRLNNNSITIIITKMTAMTMYIYIKIINVSHCNSRTTAADQRHNIIQHV